MFCGSFTAVHYHDMDSTDTIYPGYSCAYTIYCSSEEIRAMRELLKPDDIEDRAWMIFREAPKVPRKITAVVSHNQKPIYHRRMTDSRSGMKGTTIKRRLGKL